MTIGKDRINLIEIFAPVAGQLQQVKLFIDSQFTDNEGVLAPYFAHLGSQSGKMIRPAMLLLSGLCLGEITQLHIETAGIVEMLHNATLLHDDVIDEAQIRRTAPTANTKWGNHLAILLGDFIFSRVLDVCVKIDNKQINTIIAQTASIVCRGEMRQNVLDKSSITQKDYIDIISQKTAELFAASCLLGAAISGAIGKECEKFRNFGLNFGIAFQITDDLLDGTEAGISMSQACKYSQAAIQALADERETAAKKSLVKLAEYVVSRQS